MGLVGLALSFLELIGLVLFWLRTYFVVWCASLLGRMSVAPLSLLWIIWKDRNIIVFKDAPFS